MRRLLAALMAGVMLAFGGLGTAEAADPVADGQWFHEFLNTAAANQITQGDGVVVAVIDSGVDASHPDLAGSVLPGTDLTGVGDGRTDSEGHGTAMAGLIAAHGRANGIAPKAKVLPVRGTTASSDVAAGIDWTVSKHARVVSISQGADSDDLLLRQAVQRALAADVVVIAAVGNRPTKTDVGFPAAIPGVLAVAGVDEEGNHSAISVTGPEVVIAAPSDNIISTGLGGGYGGGTGTSNATAIVAGAVALVRAKYPELSAEEVIHRITATATDKGPPGRDDEYGYGVLNLVAALTAELPSEDPTSAPAETPTKAPDDEGEAEAVQVAVIAAGVALAAGLFVGAMVLWRRGPIKNSQSGGGQQRGGQQRRGRRK